MVSSSVLFMFVKKQENLRVTIYKKEITCAQRHVQYCAQWAPKVILGAQIFNMPKRNVSSNYKLAFLAAWSQFLEACVLD